MKDNLQGFPRRTSLRQLRAFGAYVKAGSISGAAETLGLTPPAVSQQLKLLEEALGGLPLTLRDRDGIRPTAAGEEVLLALGRIEAALAECADAVAAIAGVQRGSVAVGVVSTAKYWAPFALAAFQREHPEIELKVRVGNRSQIVKAFSAFELDLAIMGYPPEDQPLERATIGAHPHVIVAPPDHPLVGRRALPVAALARERFLLREPGSGTHALLRRLLESAGIRAAGDAILLPGATEIGSNESIKQAVMAGMGIALLSAHTVASEVQDGRLAVLDVEGLPIVRTWYVVRRTDRRAMPAAQALWQHMVREGPAYLPRLPERPSAARSAA
ncbi:MAG: LysR substrate-binding domain-containing protein [Geminicoccaceae bacterium]|nr:LysR family transcriptional regulator [Geminicoccaceae bacterium]MDW8371015.1 LysR substrate-binding domain-containing protein [Geminicoccaceae bacterium]